MPVGSQLLDGIRLAPTCPKSRVESLGGRPRTVNLLADLADADEKTASTVPVKAALNGHPPVPFAPAWNPSSENVTAVQKKNTKKKLIKKKKKKKLPGRRSNDTVSAVGAADGHLRALAERGAADLPP
jgi:hypothetical protein